MDLRGRLIARNGYQAILRGPLVLARDARFSDGFIYESAVVRDQDGFVDLKPSSSKTGKYLDELYCTACARD